MVTRIDRLARSIGDLQDIGRSRWRDDGFDSWPGHFRVRPPYQMSIFAMVIAVRSADPGLSRTNTPDRYQVG